MSFSNFYYLTMGEGGFDPRTSQHHIEKDFIRVRELGFNSIRFAFNGNWHKTNPDFFWNWLDQNVAWAAKHNVLLTLDLHVPIGAFWLDPTSDSVDFSIWTEETVQQENIELWRQIAERYKNSTAIGGFELLNEAVTDDATGDQWRKLARELVSAIREVNRNHLLIVGALYGTNRRYAGLTTESLFLVDDPNVMYDVHFYEPITFTHQSASWLETRIDYGGTYPDVSTPIPTGAQVLLPESSIQSQSVVEGTTDWMQYDSGWVKLDNPNAVAAIPVFVMQSGARGVVSFDNIEVRERDTANGTSRTVIDANPFGHSLKNWWEWGNVDETLSPYTFHRYEGDGVDDAYSLKISGETAEGQYLGWSSDAHWVTVTPGKWYRVTGYMKGVDVSYSKTDGVASGFVGVSLSFFSSPGHQEEPGFLFRNAEYLERQLMELFQFGVENDVPMSVMEFGTMSSTITDHRLGGGEWLKDMLHIFRKYNTSFSLWNYRSSSMGIYRHGFGERTERPNLELMEILRENL
ncbi:glycoside hydrolase family 5 protein [Marimonas sp. MJW-29]|uniref:Glycoside hydrolase family 5 protein n=1 Tax=Sulfitobacter sediminis TaxID=3234186 RepID=A0ABV3RV79_9RHOB